MHGNPECIKSALSSVFLWCGGLEIVPIPWSITNSVLLKEKKRNFPFEIQHNSHLEKKVYCLAEKGFNGCLHRGSLWIVGIPWTIFNSEVVLK